MTSQGWKSIILFVAMILALSSCSLKTLDDYASDPQTIIAQDILDRLRRGDIQSIQPMISSELANLMTQDQLFGLSKYFPKGDYIDRKLVGYNYAIANKTESFDIYFEYHFPDKWVVADTYFRKTDSGPSILGLQVYNFDKSLEERNDFQLLGKPLLHYAVLLAAIFMPAFNLFCLFLSFRTKIRRRKWLWRIFIVIGFCQLLFNWTTGQTRLELLSVSVLSAGAMRASVYSPWVIHITVPVGALVFLIRRRHLGGPPAEAEAGLFA